MLRTEEADRELISSGRRYWQITVSWARSRLVYEGYLRNDSPQGIWELSDEGWEYLREFKKGQGSS